MSHAATETLIRNYLEAFNAGNAAGMLACVSENVVHDVNQGVRREGKDAFAAFCQHMARCYREQFRDIVVLASADGRRAAAEYNIEGIYLETDEGMPPADGQRYGLPGATLFAITDGRISRVTTYFNLTDWLMQVAGGAS